MSGARKILYGVGRWILFAAVACAFGCQAYIAYRGGIDDVASLPRRDTLEIVEGPLAAVTLAPCRYQHRSLARHSGGQMICTDIFLLSVATPTGPRAIEAFTRSGGYGLDTIEEWKARIGERVVAGLAPCTVYVGPEKCIYDFQVGADHPIRYDSLLKRARGGGLAGALMIGAFASIVLLVIALAPMPLVPPRNRA